MTLARWSPGSADDRIVATLRRELLVPLPDDVRAAHLEAMLLERDWERPPEPAVRPKLRARTIVGSCVVVTALSVTSGFAAAGALPATAQHWISRATGFVGIPLPDAPANRPAPPPAGAPRHPSARPAATGARQAAQPPPLPPKGRRGRARVRVAVPTAASHGGRVAPHGAPASKPAPQEGDDARGGGNGNPDGSAGSAETVTSANGVPKSARSDGTAKSKKKVVGRASAGGAGESGKAASPLRSKSESKLDPRSGAPGRDSAE
ncbi:MAG: hypothetical protein QOG65_1932 [Actinomycetota bacterium]|nr:hypothetical protein [Actinomycetota bacterium]